MESGEILKFSRECFDRVKNVEYPENFLIGSWWRRIRERLSEDIGRFTTCEEAIIYAQNPLKTRFDHRGIDMRPIIDFKMRELERLFPGFRFEDHENLCESMYSEKSSLEEFNGRKYSNIFLTHLNYYLRSAYTFGSKVKRVVEIGAGYGGLARIFKLMNPDLSYVIVDFPESLFFAQVFLSMNLADAKVLYVDRDQEIDTDGFDFILVPVQFYQSLTGKDFDIVINTGSLQEMPDVAVNFWMDFIQNLVKVRTFYSFNYFLTDKTRFSETSGKEANFMCPVLDPFWKNRYFRINPGVITVDAAGRNWLELCVERIPAENRDLEKLEKESEELFKTAMLHSRGSNDWFQNLWMAIFYCLKREYLDEMIQGITEFELGRGAENYLYGSSNFRGLLALNEQFMRYWVNRVRGKIGSRHCGEYYYYKSLDSDK